VLLNAPPLTLDTTIHRRQTRRAVGSRYHRRRSLGVVVQSLINEDTLDYPRSLPPFAAMHETSPAKLCGLPCQHGHACLAIIRKILDDTYSRVPLVADATTTA
jgi:(E)-4-hydroxy-3-methylbut-2-enyl-diphosphate synthase